MKKFLVDCFIAHEGKETQILSALNGLLSSRTVRERVNEDSDRHSRLQKEK